MKIRNNSNFTGRPAYQNLALSSVQQVLLEQSGGHPLSVKEAEDVNSKLNQMDAWHLLSMSQQINSARIKPSVPLNNSEANSSAAHLPDSIVATILSFYKNMIKDSMNKNISNELLYIYKDTITKRLHVKKEIVDDLKNSEIIRIFNNTSWSKLAGN